MRNKRKPRPCSKAAVTRACDGDAIFSRNEFNSNKFHSWPFTQISFGFITLCQSLSCDILCLDRPSLSSKWPWTKSNSLLLLRVRFDINALSLIFKFRSRAVIGNVWIYLVNFAIVMAASSDFPRELISHCLALKLLFQDILLWIFEILNKGHCLWIWSAFLDTRHNRKSFWTSVDSERFAVSDIFNESSDCFQVQGL